ncbi:MAG TPA: glycoside hydrolase family 88 protein [bacterium]|nr:glycoside hydrolase family 88 protein [bacterium]
MTAAGRAGGLDARLQLALRAVDHAAARRGEDFPHVTHAQRWVTLAGSDGPRWDGTTWRHGNWTAGFWAGCLWLAAMWTGDERYAAAARRWAGRLAGREHDDRTHDLGFLFYPSHAVGELLGYDSDGALAARALAAARTLSTRFVPDGGYIQAWGPRADPGWLGTSTIDTMMNLPLLWWAARKTGDARFAAIAAAHATTTHRHFFRPDGSTYHLVVYSGEPGVVRRKGTFQGYAQESCWARGQSWAICGFAVAYRETGDEQHLAAAENAAQLFIRRLPEDRIPYWDFDDPAIPDAPRDSSAAAIAADGLLELSAAHPSSTQRQRYRETAAAVLEALAARCQNTAPGQVDGVLLHGCYSRPHGEGVDSALIWGDYFYLHGLAWLLEKRRPEMLATPKDV